MEPGHGQQLGPQAGPPALVPALSPSLQVADGEVPPVSSFFHLPPPARPSPGTPSATLRPPWRSVLAFPSPHAPPEALRQRSTPLYPLRPHPRRTATSATRTRAATSE